MIRGIVYEVSNRKSTSFRGIDLYKVTGVLYLKFPEFEYTVNGESIFLEDSVGAYTKIKNKYLGIDSSSSPVIFTFNKDSYIGEKDLSSYYLKSVSKNGKTFYESNHTGFSIDISSNLFFRYRYNSDLAPLRYLYSLMDNEISGVYGLSGVCVITQDADEDIILQDDCKHLIFDDSIYIILKV